MKEYQKCAKELLEFIEKSPTAFQTVANLKEVFAGLGLPRPFLLDFFPLLR